MTKIKLCGLFRPQDVAWANQAKPDFAGFVINVPRSHRSISPATLHTLRAGLAAGITPVGVFVDAPPALVAQLLEGGDIHMAQLHGGEGADYIAALRARTAAPLIKAFSVSTAADVARAAQSTADFVLLDNGGGGTGEAFDWSLLADFPRPYFLAGGLGPHNAAQAIRRLHPYALDMSSALETDGRKDREKMLAAVGAVRGEG